MTEQEQKIADSLLKSIEAAQKVADSITGALSCEDRKEAESTLYAALKRYDLFIGSTAHRVKSDFYESRRNRAAAE